MAGADGQSSGDLLADRRYAYAAAALADGDHGAAADLAAQALELAPGFAAAWLLLGQAREAGGQVPEAIAAYRSAGEADPADRLGAGIRLAHLAAADPLSAVSPGYVTALFDEYAVRFDRHLRQSLLYRGPEVLHEAVRRACSLRLREAVFARALDLGCGTGLAGELFRAQCRTLVGIDLSPGMLRRAAAKKVYDDLVTADVTAWLGREPPGASDLVLAADALVYLGDLAPLFGQVRRVLRRDGLFAFTVQTPPEAAGDVALGEDHRYAHAAAYLAREAERAGFVTVQSEPVSTRQDRGIDVPGQVLVLAPA